MRSLALASIFALTVLLGAVPAVVSADTQLTINLPPSPQAAAAAAPEASPPEQPREDVHLTGASSRKAAPAADRHGAPPRSRDEKVVGRLGVIRASVGIHVRRSSRSQTLASVRPGTYIALTGETGSWYGVLMADASTGWLPKSSVKVLDYEVLSKQSPERHQAGQGQPPIDTALLSSGQQAILREAYRFLGVPYKWGGTTANGLDCSAFVQHCFAALGVGLPRTAHEQARVGLAVTPDQLQAADRLYFASRDGRITHTGIYIGDGYFIHSSSRNGGVSISKLSDPLYRKMYAGARR